MPQTHGQMSVIIEEKLNKVQNESESLQSLSPMINTLFNVETSQNAFVQFLGVSDIGSLVSFDGQYQEANIHLGYKSRIVFPEFGIKTVDEKKMVEDLGMSNVLANARSFSTAANETKEEYAGRFWGNLDSAS